ncbi:TPA: hypothetical protein K8C35_002784 [Legionella pneumophila]|nr:hypothetical protein [Legionella pneumophila]
MNNQQEETNILNKHKNDPYQLINSALALQRQYPFDSEEFCILISEFINSKQLDIFRITLIAINSGINIFDAATLMVKILSRLDIINPDSLLDFLALFGESTKNDLASNMFYEPIKGLAGIINKNTDKIETTILTRKDSRLYGYLNAIYLGAVSKDFNVGYEKILMLLNSGDNELIATGLRSLGTISELSISKIQEIQNRVSDFCLNENMTIATNAVFALCKFAEKEKALKEKIIYFSKSIHPEIQYEIARYLQSKAAVFDEYHLELTLNICHYDLKWNGISQSLDFILFELDNNNRIEETIQIINKWISSHGRESLQNIKFEEIFHYSINNIIKNQTLLSYFATNWLNSDDSRFHYILSRLFDYLCIYNKTPVELNPEMLITLERNDLLYILRKILGYIHDYEKSIYLVASLLKIKLTPDSTNLIKSTLIEEYGSRHPLKAIEILKSLLTKDSKYSVGSKKILRACLKEITKQNLQLEKLDRIPELQPNIDTQIKLKLAMQKSISNASAEALNSSVFLGCANCIQLKEGYSWFSYNQEQDIIVNKMQKLSHSIDVPRGEMLDEVGMALARFNYRCVKRGEQ